LIRNHFRGEFRRNADILPGREDVELAGLQFERAIRVIKLFPELARVIAIDAINVDFASRVLGSVAHHAILTTHQVDSNGYEIVPRRETFVILLAQADELPRRIVFLQFLRPEIAFAALKADLDEARALAHPDVEGEWSYLDIERPDIALLDLIEG